MRTKTLCPNCQQAYAVDDSMAGQTVHCRACRTAFAVRPVSPSAAPNTPAAPTASPLIGRRYEVRSELGRGAFGVALKAFDHKMKREVAVKMLLPEALASADAVQRFLLEAEVLARLGHPHVVPIFDKGQHDGRYFLVCKLVAGKTLAELLPKGGFPDPRAAVGHAVTLCRTLAAVYAEQKVLHRDVKPANMMLEKDHLYLMDFGMAACHDKNPLSDVPGNEQGLGTIANTAVGTPAYMPPEQAVFQRDQIGPWSDLYSAGAVLYHLLTGSIPIPWRGSVLDILQVPPVAPSRHRRDLDPALDAIVLKALQKRPDERYRTGDEFADALQRWRDGSRTIPVQPPVVRAAPVPFAPPAPRPAAAGEARRSAVRSARRRDPEPETAPDRKKWLLVGGGLIVAALAALLVGVCVLVLMLSDKGGKPTAPTVQTWR